MRLIDADALTRAIKAECNPYGKPTIDFESGKKVLKIIDNAPTIEERPKDEWKCFIGSAYYGVDEDNEPIWKERKIYHCPFCNRRTVIKENFCPNCGADIRGDVWYLKNVLTTKTVFVYIVILILESHTENFRVTGVTAINAMN